MWEGYEGREWGLDGEDSHYQMRERENSLPQPLTQREALATSEEGAAWEERQKRGGSCCYSRQRASLSPQTMARLVLAAARVMFKQNGQFRSRKKEGTLSPIRPELQPTTVQQPVKPRDAAMREGSVGQIQKPERQSSPGRSLDRLPEASTVVGSVVSEAEARFSQASTWLGSVESKGEDYYYRLSIIAGFARLDVEARFSQPSTITDFAELAQMTWSSRGPARTESATPQEPANQKERTAGVSEGQETARQQLEARRNLDRNLARLRESGLCPRIPGQPERATVVSH
jgi:hypothetical protein